MLRIKFLNGVLFGAKNINYVRFAIVCTARSGSTWLHTFLNAHPNIISKGEVLAAKSYSNLNEDVFHLYSSNIVAVGLKIFYEYGDSKTVDSLKELVNNSNIRIIHLTRNDLLAQFTSLKKARQSSEWSQKGSNTVPEKIHIDFNEFQDYQQQQLTSRRKIATDFQHHQLLSIAYEDINSETERTLALIQEFLGVKPRKLVSLLKKQSTDALSKQIANWEELQVQLESKSTKS